MAYTAPTPAALKARYPAFAAVLDATVQYWLTDAERYVDQSWRENDYAPALMSRAAHSMAIGGILTSGSAQLPAGITNFKSGTFSATISDAAVQAQTKGDYGATPYGVEFRALQRRNFAGPRLAV